MSITFVSTSSGDQGLFNRLGALYHMVEILNTFRGTNSSGCIPYQATTILGLFDGAADDVRKSVDGLIALENRWQGGLDPSQIKSLASQIIIKMADDDAKLTNQTVTEAVSRVVAQMGAVTTSYVSSNTVSAAVTMSGTDGNGSVVTSVLDANGVSLQNLMPELLYCKVTNTSTPGSELINVTGQSPAASKFDWLYPRGSGASANYTAVDASGASSLLTNGTFDSFTTGWTVSSGGGTLSSEASTVFMGAASLKLSGSPTLMSMQQTLPSTLTSTTPYAFNLWAHLSGAPAAGVLRFDLIDQAGAQINDNAGTANQVDVTLTSGVSTTGWTACSGVFRLPDPVPSSVVLRVRVSTAISTGTSLYIDHLALAPMRQPSPSTPGATPWLAFFSGSTNWGLQDGYGQSQFFVTSANDLNSKWQKVFNVLFDTDQSGVTLPTSGSTLINDSLVA